MSSCYVLSWQAVFQILQYLITMRVGYEWTIYCCKQILKTQTQNRIHINVLIARCYNVRNYKNQHYIMAIPTLACRHTHTQKDSTTPLKEEVEGKGLETNWPWSQSLTDTAPVESQTLFTNQAILKQQQTGDMSWTHSKSLRQKSVVFWAKTIC